MVDGFFTLRTHFLHKQYQSITMMCHFLKLSKEWILPKSAVQAKKKMALSKGLYSAKYTFEGKNMMPRGINILQNMLTSNCPLLEGVQ